jgi:hypothetical protein
VTVTEREFRWALRNLKNDFSTNVAPSLRRHACARSPGEALRIKVQTARKRARKRAKTEAEERQRWSRSLDQRLAGRMID